MGFAVRPYVYGFVLVCGAVAFTTPAWAARGGGGGGGGGDYSLGFHLGLVGSTQSQMNDLIKRANTRNGGITTGELNSAYEAAVSLQYRFSGTIYALQLRPSYFYQKQSGKGSGGAFKYGLTGFTIFPIFRLYPLENEYMRFFMQLGLGYGRVMGNIEENNTAAPTHGSVDFDGGAFGSLAGLGAEFCYEKVHCFSLEGTYRYLTYERVIASSANGAFATGSLDQAANDKEVEVDGADLSARMGGLIFMMGYTYSF